MIPCSGCPPWRPDHPRTQSRTGTPTPPLGARPHRAAHGLAPVSADPRLSEAATVQARAVAEAGKLYHGRFESRMATFRIGGVSAENLTAGSRTVERAVARWMASPGHNENLLMPEARRIGLARADSPGHGYQSYWALVMAQ